MIAGDPLLARMRDGKYLNETRFPALRYAVPHIIPEGVTVLAGAPKVGKSWLVLDCQLSVAAGGTALGGIKCPQRPVLYLALEDGDRRMQDRCRQLLANDYRPDDPIPEGFSYITEVEPGQLIPTVAAWLAESPAGFCVIDTLGRALPPALAGQTAYERDYQVMARLKAVAAAFPGCSVVVTHHDRKADTADFVEAVSGTNGIAGGADTVILLRRERNSPDGLLRVTGRDVPEGSYALSFDAGIWTLDGGNLGNAAQEAVERSATIGVSGRGAEVIGYVVARGEARFAEIRDAFGLNDSEASSYLGRAVEAGRLAKPSRGLYTPAESVESVVFAGQGHVSDSTAVLSLLSPDHGNPTDSTAVLSLKTGPDQATQQTQHTQQGIGNLPDNHTLPAAELRHCERPGCPHRDSRPESCPGYSWKVHHDSHHKTKDKKWCCQVCCNWAARRSGGAQ